MSKQRTAGKQRAVGKQRTPGKQPASGRKPAGSAGERRAGAAKQKQPGRRPARSRPARRRTGYAGMRRTRRQRLGIAGAAAALLLVIWLFADWRLAIGLTALVLLALPAVVVLTMGRRY